MSDEQVLRWVLEEPGRLKMLGGHLHEMLDAADLKQLAKLTGGRTRTLLLYHAHNRPGLDGAYKAAARKAGSGAGKKASAQTAKRAARKAASKPRFAQHKLSNNPESIKSAAKKVHPRLRGKTEAVVGRGSRKAAQAAVKDKMRIREAGRSVKDINKVLERAADPKRVKDIGKNAGTKIGAKAVGGAGVLAGGISIATDAKGLIKGEKTPLEAAENAAWATGEGAVTAAASAAATTALAPSILAGTTALAGSTAAGTTMMAAGLATLGPIGVGIGCGIGIGYGVKKLRKATRG
jgi:hypothetical protein